MGFIDYILLGLLVSVVLMGIEIPSAFRVVSGLIYWPFRTPVYDSFI